MTVPSEMPAPDGDSDAAPGTERTGRVPWARRWGYSGYPLILVLIVVSYAFTAAQTSGEPSEIALLAQLVTVGAVLAVARTPRRVQQVADVILGAAFIAVLIVLISGLTGDGLSLILAIGAMVAYFFAPLVIVFSETRRRSIDGETLFAAICAYLLIGMFFTFLYNVFALTQGSIFGPGIPTASRNCSSSLSRP
ncbi:hypothetical protein [Leifsonia poae]|uniref:hypothetical protein n=1 Tax=Leifsonia poae TaxID=110933 RepID=UPI003D67CBBD